jgi:hypothetical protein
MKNSVEVTAVIQRRSSLSATLSRQQALNQNPFLLAEIAARHNCLLKSSLESCFS